MANLPLPLGIGEVLVDIAEGLGESAKTLVTRSRSDVGAIAIKTAKLKLDFEMALVSASGSQRQTVGVRFIELSARTTSRDRRFAAASRGSIELEIVAITDARPAPPPRQPGRVTVRPRPRPTPAPQPTLADRLAALQAALPRLAAAERRKAKRLLDRAAKALAGGDEAGARRLMLETQPLFADMTIGGGQ